MNDKNKKRRTKTYTEKEISTPALVKNRRTESVPNLPDGQYIGNNTLYNQYNINSKHIQEIHINLKDLPKRVYNKYNPEQKYSQNNSLTFRNKNNKNYSQESYNSPRINNTDANTPEYLAYIQNNTYSPPFVETYEVQFGRDRGNSMDNTYYQNKTYMNKNDNYNNNSFWKNNEYYSHNNSFVMNNTNIEDESKLNNSNQDKDYYYKNTYTNIPKPKKFKKRIPPIPIRRSNDYNINNNSFYFDDAYNENINNNIILNKQNNRYYNIKSENDKKNINYNIIHKKSKTEYKNNIYSNKTHSPRYIKDMEKVGIQISFSGKKRNESIDLISPEVFKDLKRHSSDRKKKIIISDLDMNKINKENKYNINRNNLFNNKSESYQKMRKKYIQRLSSFLLKNRKKKLAKSPSVRNEKYDIIDIKEKIKKERRNRSISNNSKLRKKETVKDNPAATSIRKEDDKGGKIDFIIPTKNIRNKTYSQTIRKGIKEKQSSSNFIINKNRITIKAAKTIQKWWRNILSQFLTELNIIKIQSVFRSYLKRKKMDHIKTEILMIKYRKRENITKIIFIQKKWKEYYISLKKKKRISKNNKNFVYKKVHKPYQKFGKNMNENNNNNNNYIQQNNSFGIISQKRKDSFDNKNEHQNDNENNIYNDLSKNGMFNDIKNNEIPSLIQTKNDFIEIKGNDDSHNDEDEDIYKCLKSDYNTERSNKNATDRTNPLFIGRNNLKFCFFTKNYYKNQEKNIIFIQRYIRHYLKCKKENFYLDDKEEKIIKIPILLFPCFVEKVRIRKNITNTNKNNIIPNRFSYNFSINNGDNINYSPKINNSDNKYDENKIKMRREKQMLIVGNKNGNNTRFVNNNQNYHNQNKNIDKQSLQNINDINYVHDIEFSINKENKEGFNQNPYIKKCYYSKENIILIKKAPNENLISKINSEKYPSSKKNILLELSPIVTFEFSGKQKNKTEYQISQNISDNYISPTLGNIESKDNNENIDNKDDNLFNSSKNIKNNPKKKNLFEICSINSEIINTQNNQKEKLGINNKKDALNSYNNQIETIVKIPVQLESYLTKNNIIIDNYKNEFGNKIINLNSTKNINCYISKVYKVDKSKYMILIQRFFRNMLIKRKMESNNILKRQIVSNNLITKEIKKNDKLFQSENDNNRILNDLKHLKNSNSNLSDNNGNNNDNDK